MKNVDERVIGIYKIISPSNKIYIGQSINLKKRFIDYKFNSNYKQIKIYRSLKKYGYLNHKFEIIEECLESQLNERERYWQDYYDVIGPNGLNCKLTSLKDKSGKLCEETKRKIGISNKNAIKKPLTELHKYNISRALKNKKLSENAKKNIIEGRKKILKKVINIKTGIIYSHASEAARNENINIVTLSSYLLNKRNNKSNIRYLNESS